MHRKRNLNSEILIQTKDFKTLKFKELDKTIILNIKKKFALNQTVFPNLDCEISHLQNLHKLR